MDYQNFFIFLLLCYFFITSTIYWVNYAKGSYGRKYNKQHGINKLEILEGTNQTTGESYGESVQFINLAADSNGNSHNYLVF